MRSTHTYVILKLSEYAYEEIRAKLEKAGYQHAFHDNDEAPASPVMEVYA